MQKTNVLAALIFRIVIQTCFILCDKNTYYSRQFAFYFNCSNHEIEQKADLVAETYGFDKIGKIFDNIYEFHLPRISKRSLRPHQEYIDNILQNKSLFIQKIAQLKHIKRKKRHIFFSDPKWQSMWYLNRGKGLDMNVIPVWEDDITGKGVVVTILDDGLEKNHPDLEKNYDPLASYDMNNRRPDPSPRYDILNSNRHGTRCAGEVAASKNNSICALGVAHNARIGGIRMLDGEVTDATEAKSLSLNPQYIDIYSASWGPDDDGKTVDGPGELALRAFMEGVTKGRRGKGSIFVWASGNGGRERDNCNCDGYTNSIYTLSISSATEAGEVPWYSESCSSTLATTYSSGGNGEKQIVTTDLNHTCTSTHTGTSASAPLAAGICALVLEANPNLTWRDMQHIVVRTARTKNLKTNDWKMNGVGKFVSHSFGYGLMDAFAMVQLAKVWKTVPEQQKCEIIAPQKNKFIHSKSVIVLRVNVAECRGVEILEHVIVTLSINAERRGDLNIQLISPAGTRVTLLAQRPHDESKNGFNKWPFMSVHTWGESPFGIWQLEIHNSARYLGPATLVNWSLKFYGSAYFADNLKNNLSINNNNRKKSFNKKLKPFKKSNHRSKESKKLKNNRNIRKKPILTDNLLKNHLKKNSHKQKFQINANSFSKPTNNKSFEVQNYFLKQPILLNYFVQNFRKQNISKNVSTLNKDHKNLKDLKEMSLILYGSKKFYNVDWNNETSIFDHIPQIHSSDSMTLSNKNLLLLNDSRHFYMDHKFSHNNIVLHSSSLPYLSFVQWNFLYKNNNFVLIFAIFFAYLISKSVKIFL